MDNISKAKELLETGKHTLVLCKGKTVYTSDLSGTDPMKDFLARGVNLQGFSAADKVVGLAAAQLFIKAGVAAVYGKVTSRRAKEAFEKKGIAVSYGKLTNFIKNKKGTGICPMEVRAARLLNGGKLGFGVMRMPLLNKDDPTSFDYEQINKMTDEFLGAGFDYFDTAHVYHGGKSEEMVKKCLVQRYPRDCFRVATKLPLWDIKTRADMQKIFDKQLENCGVTYFDNYLLHAVNNDKYKTIKELDAFGFGFNLKKQGLVKEFGFSIHDTPDLLDEILTENPGVDFVQLQINYADWDNAAVASRRCYAVALKHNVPVIVMEPVKGGTLATGLPDKAAELFKEFAPDASLASWAIRYCASLPGVKTVLSGMSNREQMRDNLSFMREFKPLAPEETAVVNQVQEIIKQTTAIGCTGCGYCVADCPQKIAIPDYFALYNDAKRNPASLGAVMYYRNISATRGKPSSCLKCGACESKCPQKLEIIKSLKLVAGLFEQQ